MLLHLDDIHLFTKCHCGGTTFSSSRFLSFDDCKVISCTNCGQMRTWPEPDPKVNHRLYSPESEKYHGRQFSDSARSRLWGEYGNRILNMIEAHTPPPGRLLDVGCNCGDLLYAARARGWDAEGLEINAANAHQLSERGFVVFDRPLEECSDLENGRYDALVINQVLEHVHQVNPFLQSIKRVLKPGGSLFVGVPAFWSPIPIVIQRRRWYALLPDEHVWQFSKRSAENLLETHHFRVAAYVRGCSAFWGKPTWNPRTWIRWCLYRLVSACRQGDFHNFVVVNEP